MKLYVVGDADCTYAVKVTLDDARTAAREAWMDVAYPEEWSIDISTVETDDTAPQHWPTVEVAQFDGAYGFDVDE